MMIGIIVFVIGIMLVCAGAYYLKKEKQDVESKKIYTITCAIGAVIAIGGLIKLFPLV